MDLELLLNEAKRLDESGIQGIKKLRKRFDSAEIYFHIDTDGVCSAIGMKAYLEQYKFKVTAVHPIQYGSMEYAIPKGKTDTMKVLVDFAHGKHMFDIHQDHHEGQVGVKQGTATSFKKSPSGAGIISGQLSPKEIFPASDLHVINTVDSADFASQDLTPDDIMRASFKVNKTISVKDNHLMMGLVVNKLLLTYKNKKGFLPQLVMQAKPSMFSMYNIIKKLAIKEGYKTPEQIGTDSRSYIEQQEGKFKTGKVQDVMTLKTGESIMVGNLLVQYGGGYMGKGKQYDRYTPFKLHPEANYMTIAWPVGLVQLSQNPFKKLDSDLHLGDIMDKKVMPKFKADLKAIDISLKTIKRVFEMDIMKKKIEGAVGFGFNDLIALYGDKIKNLKKETKWFSMIEDITNKPFGNLTFKQKDLLSKVTITAWDVIQAGSGGHKAITNSSGYNFIMKDQYDGGYVSMLHKIQYEIAKVMQDK